MRRSSLALLVLMMASLAGCEKKASPEGAAVGSPSSDAGETIAEPFHGDEGLAFRIDRVHEKQSPTKAPPFHAPGGKWTFFDATTADGVPFGFGFDEPKSGGMVAFGKVILTVPDGAAGKRLVQTLARTLHGKVPPEKPAQPLAPSPFAAAFLATDANDQPGGGYGGTGGAWYATKLFLQKRGIAAEVFLNFNLRARAGAFREKEPDYADGVVAYVADELRDGPRPRRTPESDPRLSAKGPTFAWVREVAGRVEGMTPERDHLLLAVPVEGGGERLVATRPDREETVELVRVPHLIDSVACSRTACVVVDRQKKTPHVMSPDDPRTFWLVDRKTQKAKVVNGAWGQRPSLPRHPWSSDGTFFVVEASTPATGGREGEAAVHLVRLDGTVRGPVKLGEADVDVVSVTASRVVVRARSGYGADARTTWLAFDPASLKVTPTEPVAFDERPSFFRDDGDSNLSADGKRRVTCRSSGAEIVVQELPSGPERVFAVHEDDREDIADHCVRWAGPRRLEYRSNVRGWLDLATMKIGGTLDESIGRLAYDATGTWAFAQDAERVRIGKLSP
jgi:hypothetical protein